MDRATTFRVPLIDLKAQYLSLKEEIDEAVAHVHEKGNYVMGEQVSRFEKEWARDCNAKYCVATSSGTDAIYLGVRSSATVFGGTHIALIPAFTFIATYEAVHRAGLAHSIHLADVEEDTAVISEESFHKAVDLYGTCLCIPVNLYGKKSMKTAPRPGCLMLEDAAQSHGVPLSGDIAAYSFYPTKNLGASGQAGALVTNDVNIYAQAGILRAHAEGVYRFHHESLSGNYRMDELQAAILRVKRPHLKRWNQRRREIARIYRQAFEGILKMQEDSPEHVYHVFAVRHPKIEELSIHLAKSGIQTASRYPLALHQQEALSGLGYKEGDFPNAERWARENLSLPIYPELSDEKVGYVVEEVLKWIDLQD